jgi:hypothetical protein
VYTCKQASTRLLREEPDDKAPPFSGATIDIDHEKKVDLGVLRGADHDGRVPVSPFSTVDGVYVKFKVTVKLLVKRGHVFWTQRHRLKGVGHLSPFSAIRIVPETTRRRIAWSPKIFSRGALQTDHSPHF